MTREATSEPARVFLGEALGCDPASLPHEPALGNPAAWDSIGHMHIVFGLEERLGRLLTAEEIVAIATIDDVARLLTVDGPRSI